MDNTELKRTIDQARDEGKTELSLMGRNIADLPADIGRLADLATLNLANNHLGGLPPEIGRLKNLKTLNLANNDLDELPPEIGQLTNLESLVLSDNKLTCLSTGVETLVRLKKLDLTRNALRSLPEINALRSLEDLALGGNDFEKAPVHRIDGLTNLLELHFWGVRMTEFPTEFTRFTQLRSLHLTSNDLTEIPRDIERLIHLEHLSLSNNQLRRLPPEIGRLANLEQLYLNNNELDDLPPEIGKLVRLEQLYLNNNHLGRLPPEIGDLARLEQLYLDNNHLNRLPPEIGDLTRLEQLILNGNRLSELPTEFFRLERLRLLEMDDMPSLRFPTEEIVELGVKAIRSFLRASHIKGRRVWESKVLFVGEGAVGKTTLYNVLDGASFNEHEQGTVGIEIGDLHLPHPDLPGIEMQLNCWDFAGQDFNHATHQFFFSNRSLFLLVWNARYGHEQCKLHRWLENIEARSPGARVILVATHLDQPHSDYPLADLKKKFPQIKDAIMVSSKDNRGIPELRRMIRDHAADLPLMGLRWPERWLAAAEAVRGMTDTNISRLELNRLMRDNGLRDSEAEILTRWLHDLGHILHFHDEPKMRDRVVLDPEWVTAHVGRVLRSEEVTKTHGILTRDHLRTLWPDLDGHLRDYLLRVMDKFDLAYFIPDDEEDRSLIVERLPHDPVNYQEKWDEFKGVGSELKLRFKLGSMQPGIPTWFIARCHRFTMNLHWRNGVLFKDAEPPRHCALVEADPEKKVVDMTVRGPFPQRFMSLLQDGFKDTLKRYKGLTVERVAPCPGYNEYLDAPCKNEFKLDILENKLIRNQSKNQSKDSSEDSSEETFVCNDCDKRLSLMKLVEGVGAVSITRGYTDKRFTEKFMKEFENNRREHEKTQREIRETREGMSSIYEILKDYIAFSQRNFINLWKREQEREMVTCPNVFTVWGKEQCGVFPGWRIYLQLYCQQPGCWHSIGEDGLYTFTKPARWLKEIAPYLSTLKNVLEVVVPLAAAAAPMVKKIMDISKAVQNVMPTEFNSMMEFLEQADPAGRAREPFGETVGHVGDAPTVRTFSGADMVVIRRLMDEFKDREPCWGGLTRMQSPEGDILWLCKEHRREYESGRRIEDHETWRIRSPSPRPRRIDVQTTSRTKNCKCRESG